MMDQLRLGVGFVGEDARLGVGCLGPSVGGEGQMDSVGCPYVSARDDCNPSGGSSYGVAGRLLVGSLTVEQPDCQQSCGNVRCIGSAARRCMSCRSGAVGSPTFRQTCPSVCLSFGVVLFPALRVPLLRSSVGCCSPVLSGPGRLVPMQFGFGVLAFTHDDYSGCRVFVPFVGHRPLSGFHCLFVGGRVVVVPSVSPSEPLTHSSSKIISSRRFVVRPMSECFGSVCRSHLGSIGRRFAIRHVGTLVGHCRNVIGSRASVGEQCGYFVAGSPLSSHDKRRWRKRFITGYFLNRRWFRWVLCGIRGVACSQFSSIHGVF